MSRLDHAAFESDDPDRAAAFYRSVLGARIVRAAGHPVMACVGSGGFAFHERGGPDGRQLEAITYMSGEDPLRP